MGQIFFPKETCIVGRREYNTPNLSTVCVLDFDISYNTHHMHKTWLYIIHRRLWKFHIRNIKNFTSTNLDTLRLCSPEKINTLFFYIRRFNICTHEPSFEWSWSTGKSYQRSASFAFADQQALECNSKTTTSSPKAPRDYLRPFSQDHPHET